MPLKLNRNFALLYGIMLGDGCLSLVYGKKKYIDIAGSMQDDIPFFEEVIKHTINSLIDRNVAKIKFDRSKNTIHFNFISNRLFDFISSFGFPIGKKGTRLFIPKEFYDLKLVKYVIKGFFATDGSLVLTDNNGTLYPRVEATSISDSLLREINNFLNYKKIKCNFYKAKRRQPGKGSYPNKQESYRLQINGKSNLKKFVRVIGFVNPKQIEKLNHYYGCTEN